MSYICLTLFLLTTPIPLSYHVHVNKGQVKLYPPSPIPPSITKGGGNSHASASDLTLIENPSSQFQLSSDFLWTEQRLRSVTLLADGKYTDKEVCQMVGIAPSTLKNWKNHPRFQERLSQLIQEFQEKILTQGIAVKINRIAALNYRHNLLSRVIEQRASSAIPDLPNYHPYSKFYNPEIAQIPGADTGLLAIEEKSIRLDKESYTTVLEGKVDTALLLEMRRLEEQAARETGQWTENHQINILQKAYIGIDINQV